MGLLKGKKVLLGICGSIAAYKSAFLIRLLVKEGAEVRVIMTESAKTFITPLTLSTLSKNPVLSKFEKNESGEWNNHVELGMWGDVFLIAPASANTLAAFANGICQNLMEAVYLSAKCPVIVAPAMDLDMHDHLVTQQNLAKLRGMGVSIADADHGELASGLVGPGRMAEPEALATFLKDFFRHQNLFTGKQFLITAGPTHEPIDPVRFIGNHSSGKMGYAIAEKAAEMGAKVNLVSGPTSLNLQHPNVNLVRVTSAQEMFESSMEFFPKTEVTVLAAAVADYTPETKFSQKVKKKADQMSLDMVKTKDIAASLGELKEKDQIIVGFALETNNELENAIQKLDNKNFDLIVLNSLKDKGAGFGGDTNKVTIIDREHAARKFDLKSKKEVAEDILESILSKLDG